MGDQTKTLYCGFEPDPADRTQLALDPGDAEAFAAQGQRETHYDRHMPGEWIEITDQRTGDAYRVRHAPCGAGCRCAAEAERIDH